MEERLWAVTQRHVTVCKVDVDLNHAIGALQEEIARYDLKTLEAVSRAEELEHLLQTETAPTPPPLAPLAVDRARVKAAEQSTTMFAQLEECYHGLVALGGGGGGSDVERS